MDETPAVWTKLYPAGVDETIHVADRDLVTAWRGRVEGDPDGVALVYFDVEMTARQVDSASDALAVALGSLGTRRGDHIGIYLQNVPAYPVTLLALWKLGATALLLNPMYKGRELRHLIDDARAVGIVHADRDGPELATTLNDSTVGWRVSTSPMDVQTRTDKRVFPDDERHEVAPDGDFWQLIEQHQGERPPDIDLSGDDVALLTYTSGTTGPPKGAMNTHSNVLHVVRTLARWLDLGPNDVVLALAPFFHITGAVVNATIALMEGCPLVLINRFHPEVALEAFKEHGVTYTVGSITAFNAMLEVPWAESQHFASARVVYSGGAPVPPATIERFQQRFGVYIHNAYGMTETTSGVIAVPPGVSAPVDETSGSLSIGVPLPNLDVRVIDETGEPVEPGTEGELEITGPQVIPGYWQNPAETSQTLPGGHLHTGDAAIMDSDGWVYLVDRIKDQINVSGFKVWPREVEDVLYEHPAVLEAAVIGRPDDYRGETVVAYVSIKSGQTVEPDELIEFVRGRLAAYKAPRQMNIIKDLPKTPTGKIRRNILRSQEQK